MTFSVGDITDPYFSGEYDLVIPIEGIHDLARPVDALATIRRVLAPGGTAIALEERTMGARPRPSRVGSPRCRASTPTRSTRD